MTVQAGLCQTWSETQIVVFSHVKALVCLISNTFIANVLLISGGVFLQSSWSLINFRKICGVWKMETCEFDPKILWSYFLRYRVKT